MLFFLISSISDPDCSGFKFQVWILIRIWNPDPDPAIESDLF